MFSLVHAITDNPWAVGEATRDVIRDFAADGVVYLELRTTPRQVPGSGVQDPNPPAYVIVGFLGNRMGKRGKNAFSEGFVAGSRSTFLKTKQKRYLLKTS
jgi:hypothetical protein